MKKIKRTFLVTLDDRIVAEFVKDDDIEMLNDNEHVFGAYRVNHHRLMSASSVENVENNFYLTEDDKLLFGKVYKISTERKYQNDSKRVYVSCRIIDTDDVYKRILIETKDLILTSNQKKRKQKRTFLVTFDDKKVAEFAHDDDIEMLNDNEHVYGAYRVKANRTVILNNIKNVENNFYITDNGMLICGKLYKISTERKHYKGKCKWCALVDIKGDYKRVLIDI